MPRLASILRSRTVVLTAGLAAIAAIALADRILTALPWALLYLAPIAAVSTVLKRWQVPLLGALCTVAAELSDDYPLTLAKGIPRDALYFFAFTGVGLYVAEALHRRRVEAVHLREIETETETRRAVEEQLRLLIDNSSIAIVTVDETGGIVQANGAAEQLFAGETLPVLPGSALATFLPALAHASVRREGRERLRTMMQCQGFREGGDPFLADVWFSTYATSSGARLTAMIADASHQVREREEASLEQMLVGSKLAIGALSHEIRNICAAISVVEQNLRLGSTAAGSQAEEFEALGLLVAALEQIASVELSMVKRQGTRLRLNGFLRDLYVVLHASLREAGIALVWQVEEDLPEVWAHAPSLTQVFLNLVRNVEHACAGTAGARLHIVTCKAGDRVRITVNDNGPGVSHPEQLFRPFAADNAVLPGIAVGTLKGHEPAGLGLYLSRAMLRSAHGDLVFVPGTAGATFVIELSSAGVRA